MSGRARPVPFRVAVPGAAVDDLRARLAATRWPDEPREATTTGWGEGTDPVYLRDLAGYWRDGYDWPAQEARLNELPQFTAEVDGTTLHFAHVRGGDPAATPLLLAHGWPDTFDRFHKLVPLLTGAFSVVVPSLPGFGFSTRRPATAAATADLFAALMTRTLGYGHFVAAGGDVGGGVVRALAARHPDVVRAIHLTDVGYPTGREDPATMTGAERRFADDTRRWVGAEGAYLLLQATKPRTLAPALDDSPAGLASWIVGMIRSQATGDGPDGGVEAAFGGRDALLTNVSLYWFTATAGSSARTYRLAAAAARAEDDQRPPAATDRVPAGIALFPRELQFPREWAARTLNVRRYERMPRGGHFAALEEPELLAGELRAFLA